MTKPSKKAVLSGSILGLALAVGFTAADAGPGKSQASDHMSKTAKDKLESLGYPGRTEDVVQPGETKCGDQKDC